MTNQKVTYKGIKKRMHSMVTSVPIKRKCKNQNTRMKNGKWKSKINKEISHHGGIPKKTDRKSVV